ncbi:MAG: hypothetical protein IJU90_08905 [Bacteroidales bacterium]|nr:hypothetical protein [Bacteroidales bacterium]
MKKLLNKGRSKLLERNRDIRKMYNKYISQGSDKTATMEYVAKEFGLSVPRIYQIVNSKEEE